MRVSLKVGDKSKVGISCTLVSTQERIGNTNLIMFGHGCSGNRMRSEHERYHALGVGVVAVGCTRNTNVIMVWRRVLPQSDALGTRTSSCFGHGCCRNWMHSEHKRYSALDGCDLEPQPLAQA